MVNANLFFLKEKSSMHLRTCCNVVVKDSTCPFYFQCTLSTETEEFLLVNFLPAVIRKMHKRAV